MDWQDHQPDPGDTVVDEAIRQSLRQSMGDAEPSNQVWQRLRSQVAAGPSPQRRRVPAATLGSRFAPLIQGLVATSLLLLLGLSLRTSLWEQAYRFGANDDQHNAPADFASNPAPVATSADGMAGLTYHPSEDLEGVRALQRAARQASVTTPARPQQPDSDQTLAALNKRDDLIDARDTRLAPATVAHPEGNPIQSGATTEVMQPVRMQPY